jgi:hypothetical protein
MKPRSLQRVRSGLLAGFGLVDFLIRRAKPGKTGLRHNGVMGSKHAEPGAFQIATQSSQVSDESIVWDV